MVKHAIVGSDLSRAEWEAGNTHIVNDIPAGYLLGSDGSNVVGVNPATLVATHRANIEFTLGDGVDFIASSEPDQWIEIPFTCNITSAHLTADVAGNIQVDIWRSTYITYPPVDGGSITGSNPVILSSAIKNQNSLVGWTIELLQGDWLKVHVDSVSLVKRVVVSIGVVSI